MLSGVLMELKRMNINSLPRLLTDPRTGMDAVEYLPLGGEMPRTLDRRMIIGAFISDVVRGGRENAVTHRNVGFFEAIPSNVATAHHYEVLRDLLFPHE